jgi:Aromatic-ring-opening dioxygenase LigAB, LigA subunit
MALEHFSNYFDRDLATHRLVQDLKADREGRELLKRDDAAVLDRYELTPQERAAVESRDFRALYLMGVHPYSLSQLSRLLYGTVEGGGASEASVALVESLLRDATAET